MLSKMEILEIYCPLHDLSNFEETIVTQLHFVL